MSFLTGTQMECLYTLTAQVTKNTYTTQAPIGPLTATAPIPAIPAGFFASVPNGVGRALYFKAAGTITNAATAATFSPAIALDSTANTALNPITIYSTVAPTASTVAQWNVEAWITCQALGQSAGMTLQVNGTWQQASVATGGALNATGLGAEFAGNLTGLNSSIPYFVELFGTWSGSSSSNSTVLQQMFLFGLN